MDIMNCIRPSGASSRAIRYSRMISPPIKPPTTKIAIRMYVHLFAHCTRPHASAMDAQLQRYPRRHATSRCNMSLFVWIVLGLISGFIASHLVNRRGEGMLLDVLLGIVGAIIGGWLFHWFGREGVNGLNIHSFFVATVGAVLFLVVFHMFRRVV